MAVKKPQLPKGLTEYSEDQLAKKLIEWTQSEAKGLQSFINDLLATVNIPIVDTAPVEEVSHPPLLKLMDNGAGTRRLYVYYEGDWSYIELTGGGGAPSVDAFGNIAIAGQTTVEADEPHDTVTLIEGTDFTITTDHVNDTITMGISAGAMTHNHDDRYYTESEVDTLFSTHASADDHTQYLLADGSRNITGSMVSYGTTFRMLDPSNPYFEAQDTDTNLRMIMQAASTVGRIGTYTDHDLQIRRNSTTMLQFTADTGDVTGVTVKDEDDMVSNSDVHLATQQSIKAYADLMLPLAGGLMTGELELSAGVYLNVPDAGDVQRNAFGAVSGTGILKIGSTVMDIDLRATGITGTAIKDEDNMASNSDSHLASQQSIKAYVDSGAGGTLDHGLLAGKGDDDHIQYLLVDGTRAMADDLNMGSNHLIGLGSITMTGYQTISATAPQIRFNETDQAEGSDYWAVMSAGNEFLIRHWDNSTSTFSSSLRIEPDSEIDVANSLIVLDEDDMVSNDAKRLATQQSIKAYADLKLPLAGGTLTGPLTITSPVGMENTMLTLESADAICSLIMKDSTSTGNSFFRVVGDTVAIFADATEVIRWDVDGLGIDVANSDCVLDEDTMSSDDPKRLATQQSIKAYVDTAANGNLSHSLLANLANDDHTQYALLNCARDFTGQMQITPAGGQNTCLTLTSIDPRCNIILEDNTSTGASYIQVDGDTIAICADTVSCLKFEADGLGIDVANSDSVLDEDTLVSNDPKRLATQQSIKAYADLMLPLTGGSMTGDIYFPNDEGITGMSGAMFEIQTADSNNLWIGKGIDSNRPRLEFSNSYVRFYDVLESTAMIQCNESGSIVISPTTTITLNATGISGTAIKDEDTFTSNSDTHLATQQSIKAYVDYGDSDAFQKSSDTIDDILDGSSYVKMLVEERTKLTGIETGADVTANHGQPCSWLTDAGALVYLDDLDDIPDGSFYNKLPATLKDALDYIAAWQHPSDATYMNGNYVYPDSITAEHINVASLDALSSNIGVITAGLMQGIVIEGSVFRTASAGKYVELDNSGMTLVVATTDKYAEFKYGEGYYGTGALAYIHHADHGVPFYIAAEQIVADFHFYNRSSNPTGAAEIGDVCVVDTDLKICTSAGTPGTWKKVSRDDDAIHDNVASEISAITEKTAVVAADKVLLEDSEDSNAKKMAQVGNLVPYPTFFKANLKIVEGTTSTSQVTVTADELVVTNSSGGTVLLANVSEADIDITSSGVQGLDTGSEAASTLYYIYIIYNGTTVAGLLSTSASSPTMPDGYTHKRLVGEVYNNSSSHFVPTTRENDKVFFKTNQNIFSALTLTTSFVSHNLPVAVPAGCDWLYFEAGCTNSAYAPWPVVRSHTSAVDTWGDGGTTSNVSNAFTPSGWIHSKYGFMIHDGGSNVYVRANRTANYAYQCLAVWGYRLPR